MLFRSSVVDPARRWAPLDRPIGCPTLVLWGGDDPYAPPEFGARVAERTGAELVGVRLIETRRNWFDCGAEA